MSRADIHRPGAIVPGDYEYVAVFYHGDDTYLTKAYSDDPAYKEAVESADARLFAGNWLERRTCDSCGATFNHGALMRHKDGELVHFGHICADRQIGLSSEAHRAKDAAIARARGARPIIARHASTCRICARAIPRGGHIASSPEHGWVHKDCLGGAPIALRQQRAEDSWAKDYYRDEFLPRKDAEARNPVDAAMRVAVEAMVERGEPIPKFLRFVAEGTRWEAEFK